jgi:hypothetical protein
MTWLARSMSLHPMFLKISMMTSVGRLSITSIVAKCLSSKYSSAKIDQCRSANAQRSALNVQRSIFNGGGMASESKFNRSTLKDHVA